MILPDKKDAIHKAWLYRILEAIADGSRLAEVLYFKGGTCAAMLGWLPRFSVDLDFDYAGKTSQKEIIETRSRLEAVFSGLGLTVKDSSKNGIRYFLKYPGSGEAKKNSSDRRLLRNTVKVDVGFPLFKSSQYEPRRFTEIDRVLTCQTKETMVAHKLVAPLDRYEKTGGIAGRDIFDIHHFLLAGFAYDPLIIKERRAVPAKKFLLELADFIKDQVTEKVITEDLSSLLPPIEFSRIRKILKREVMSLLREEIGSGE
ncbi:MAG: nucleotidyl transferase AbiEii/AbiGii toxin family protein [bacterium]|nr:nucleotidyl transferase AbiEii/AbiGii toxin family protein [bacterium]